MAKPKKIYYDKVKDLLNEHKEEGAVEHIEDICLDSRYGMGGCDVCKNFDSEKEYCNTYDCNPDELEVEEGIFVLDYCDKFTLDEIKEAQLTADKKLNMNDFF